MTVNTTTTTRRVTAQHDCADYGCLAAMLGVELDDATAGTAEESSGNLVG